MIKYQFNSKNKVLEVTYEGKIKPNEILQYNEFILKNKELPRELKILVDAQTAAYDFSIDTVQELKKMLFENLKFYTFIKVAFLHNNPKETAISMLIEEAENGKNYFHNIFLSREKAIMWLNN